MNFDLVTKIIDFQDTLYVLKRIVKEEYIDASFVQEYKEWIGCDTVLKKDGLYYFTNKVEEAQVIEYLSETKQ